MTMTDDMRDALDELRDDTARDAFRAALSEGLFGNGEPTAHVQEFRGRYAGHWPTAGAYMQSMAQDLYGEALAALPIEVRTAIDWEHAAMQAQANGGFVTASAGGPAVYVLTEA